MCEPEGNGSPLVFLGAVAALAVAVLTAGALSAVLPFAGAVAAVIGCLCVAGSWVVWRLIRYGAVREMFRRHRRVPVTRPAITVGPRAIEGKIYSVTPDMILARAIEEEAR